MDRKEWDALGNPPGSFDTVLEMGEQNAQAKYIPLDDRCGFCGCECAFRRCPCAKSGVFCTACGCDS